MAIHEEEIKVGDLVWHKNYLNSKQVFLLERFKKVERLEFMMQKIPGLVLEIKEAVGNVRKSYKILAKDKIEIIYDEVTLTKPLVPLGIRTSSLENTLEEHI